MRHVFKYSVLIAVPDRSRGERVNVGLVIFKNGEVDVRIPEVSKLRLLTGKDWGAYTTKVVESLRERINNAGAQAPEQLANYPRIDPAFEVSKAGSFLVRQEEEYSLRVNELLLALVSKPKNPGKEVASTRINTEISKHLKKFELLGKADEQMDSHKVFRNYLVEEGLNADFIQKNGVMRVTATLDLRKPVRDLKEAALKSIVMDRAKAVFGSESVCLGVYASTDPNAPNIKSHLNMMREYSNDNIYNWENSEDRARLTKFMIDGYRVAGSLI